MKTLNLQNTLLLSVTKKDRGRIMKFLNSLKNYKPYNEQESKDKEFMLSFINTNKDVLNRSNTVAHFTASSWIVNKNRDKILMIYHNIYDSWSWTGGHADGDDDLLEVALKEAMEETGLKKIKAIDDEIYSLEVITVDGHVKRGEYVSSHLHLNLTYLLEADDLDELVIKEDENSDIKWFSINDAVKASTEPWMQDFIYKKLNKKLTII